MRTKQRHFFLLLLILLLGSLTSHPVLANPHPTRPLPTAEQVAAPSGAQVDDEASAESASSGQGWLIGLVGASLVIVLTAVGVLLNRRNNKT